MPDPNAGDPPPSQDVPPPTETFTPEPTATPIPPAADAPDPPGNAPDIEPFSDGGAAESAEPGEPVSGDDESLATTGDAEPGAETADRPEMAGEPVILTEFSPRLIPQGRTSLLRFGLMGVVGMSLLGALAFLLAGIGLRR